LIISILVLSAYSLSGRNQPVEESLPPDLPEETESFPEIKYASSDSPFSFIYQQPIKGNQGFSQYFKRQKVVILPSPSGNLLIH